MHKILRLLLLIFLLLQLLYVSEADEDGQLPLGMMPDIAYSDCEMELQTGDMVIFYTDGIIEAENESEEMYGTERLMDLVAGMDPAESAEGMIEAIFQDVAHFVGSAKQYDDITIVSLKKSESHRHGKLA